MAWTTCLQNQDTLSTRLRSGLPAPKARQLSAMISNRPVSCQVRCEQHIRQCAKRVLARQWFLLIDVACSAEECPLLARIQMRLPERHIQRANRMLLSFGGCTASLQ
jgi:hypothetical protein